MNYFDKISRSLSSLQLRWLPSKSSDFASTIAPHAAKARSGVPSQAYLIKGWPELDAQFKTASIYRTVSFMATHPVSWDWLCNSLSKNTTLAVALLNHLDHLQVLEILQVRFEPFEGRIAQAIALDMLAKMPKRGAHI